MAEGQYKFQYELGNNDSISAQIRLRADLKPGKPININVHFDPSLEHLKPVNWWMGVQFAAAYVWDSWKNPPQQGLNIQVLEIKGHIYYTNTIIVAYTTVFALLQALEWNPSQVPSFDPITREFHFPRWIG